MSIISDCVDAIKLRFCPGNIPLPSFKGRMRFESRSLVGSNRQGPRRVPDNGRNFSVRMVAIMLQNHILIALWSHKTNSRVSFSNELHREEKTANLRPGMVAERKQK